MTFSSNLSLSEAVIAQLADELWGRFAGSNCDPIEMNLRAKLALEHSLRGKGALPFGLDKLGTEETAAYIGIKAETLRDRVKRRILGVPPPYNLGRKLFWRRSELDQWIERQRLAEPEPIDVPKKSRAIASPTRRT
jgi:predicted DNA-binding transcriptional regulator AlpA